MACVRKLGFDMLRLAPLIEQLSNEKDISEEHKQGLRALKQQIVSCAVCTLSYFPQGVDLNNYAEGEDRKWYIVESDEEEAPPLEGDEVEDETINHDSAGSCTIV